MRRVAFGGLVMVDPRRVAIFVDDKKTRQMIDKTAQVDRYRISPGLVEIVFVSGDRPYHYRPERVMILGDPVRVELSGSMRVEVDGTLWSSVSEILIFAGPGERWTRVFYRKGRSGEEAYRTYPEKKVRVFADSIVSADARAVFGYWRAVAARREADDPLRRAYDRMDFVHPESALARYLEGASAEHRAPGLTPIFPFFSNLSQQQAVDNALNRSISVVEGPPGTGKTETILNVIANIVVARAGTVGVVSYNNAAVDNVGEKLTDAGFGHMVAVLGRLDRREEFFAHQPARNARLRGLLDDTPGRAPPQDRIADLAGRLRRLQLVERRLAERRAELDAYRLERRHFDEHVERDEVADDKDLPLLRRSADRILDFMVITELERQGARPGVVERVRRYFRYGSTRGLDPDDIGVVLRLQAAYYDKRISELTAHIEGLDAELRHADIAHLAEEYRERSVEALRASLDARYRSLSGETYSPTGYRRGSTFGRFALDYPVMLSTCHSVRASVAEGFLFDVLIIDEASQVGLLEAGLALSCCRNLVVVGDLRQLRPIADGAAEGLEPPRAAYDCRRHSILSLLLELYDDLPRTMLREHYRCDPAIIGFCNKAFYGGELVPYTVARADQAMVLAPTVAGNHMRQHRGGGRSNQREVDVIVEEVIPAYCAGVPGAEIGITTPYRRQVDKAADALIAQVERFTGAHADTVHRFQGRQRTVMIMTTVLDETWRGRTGLRFADDPHLVNVAVSRAIRRFVLVTNNDMMPTSRHFRDLVDYIRYQTPGTEVTESAVISVFDLLYRDYSDRLRPLAARVKNETRYRSEDITRTVLGDILAEERYSHLTCVRQVLLRNLLPGLDGLTPEQEAYVRHRASVDFVVYSRVSNRPTLAVEVDGFAFHENNPAQLARDTIKNAILAARGLPLLRLATTGSGEEDRIRRALDAAENQRLSPTGSSAREP